MFDTLENLLRERKAEGVCTYPLVQDSLWDVAIVATALSDRHVEALAEYALRYLKSEGEHPRTYGRRESSWVVIDADHVLVHIMRQEARDHYALDNLYQM